MLKTNRIVMLPRPLSSAPNQVRQTLRIAGLLIFFVFATVLRGQPLSSPSPASVPNDEVLRAQLFLDGSNFKPGVIDGRWGEFMRKALIRYEAAQGKKDEQFGEKPPEQFDLPLDQSRPLLTSYAFSPND